MENVVTQTDLQQKLRQLLRQLGVNLPTYAKIRPGQNLLSPTCVPAARPREWLSWGFPNGTFPQKTEGKDSLFWCPRGLPKGKAVFLASSRLSQALDKHHDWFNAFRTLACRIKPGNEYLLTSKGTTADRFVKRAANLFGFDYLDVRTLPEGLPSSWRSSRTIEGPPECFPGFAIPLNLATVALGDKKLIEIAQQVCVLSVRRGGNIEKAILERCAEREPPNVFLLHSNAESKPKTQTKLLNAGCHCWMLIPSEESSTSAWKEYEFRIPLAQRLPSNEFLIHCTRPRVGPWPDQDEEQFLDDLIFQNSRANHSANAALSRIMATGFIWGTNQLTRDKQNVVCFTEVNLNDLASLRKFRSHLSRWDFLPVGIAIRKSVLQSLGAKPVIYGDESTWSSLDESERPFFQVANSETKTGKSIDWTLEHEWRVLGDLNLNQIKRGDIYAIRLDEFV